MALYGSVEHGIDIAAVSAQLNVTAVDVFVYDTSKDSDGGAWRNRCQHTSWYNETLNTATRGSRREFPSVAIIVMTSTGVTIYDGDDPALPMWMVFQYNSNSAIRTMVISTAISALNGKLSACGRENGGLSYSSGICVVSFIDDKAIWKTNAHSGIFGLPLSSRNINGGYGQPAGTADDGGDKIILRDCNDVAMTVLPNAPIDTATGLPIPTIAVATDDGVSVIKDDGSVVDISDSDLATFYKVEFIGEKLMIQGQYLDYSPWVISIPNSDDTGWARVAGQPANTLEEYSITGSNNKQNANLFYYGYTGANGNKPMVGYKDYRFLSSAYAVSIVNANPLAPSNGMVSYINSSFNTGWMPGNIKGAWLSSNVQETLSAPTNLITNGTFDTGVASWSGGPLTWDNVNQRAQVTGTTLYGGISQIITTTIGKTYYYEADVDCSVSDIDVRIQISGIGLLNPGAGQNNTTGNKKIYGWLTATATAHTLQIIPYGNNYASTYYVDNVNFYEVEADHSVNDRGLQVFGSVTKSPVATGADLVAYSGFSASNYLKQPYNSALDFGTGDFSIMVWVKTTSNGSYQVVVARAYWNGSSDVSLIAITILNLSPYLEIRNSSGTNQYTPTSATPIASNVWTHLCGVRRSGMLYMYANGKLISTNTGNLDVSGSSTYPSTLTIGASQNGTVALVGSIALARISATAPTAEQIKKIYEDEKVLFQENAKATLYGASNAVTALAYDDATNLLHVGTSAGRSVFSGLRRVDNTTTAVGTAISAHDGLVAEE